MKLQIEYFITYSQHKTSVSTMEEKDKTYIHLFVLVILNKQDMVTTLSTEAELLAMSHEAKKAI